MSEPINLYQQRFEEAEKELIEKLLPQVKLFEERTGRDVLSYKETMIERSDFDILEGAKLKTRKLVEAAGLQILDLQLLQFAKISQEIDSPNAAMGQKLWYDLFGADIAFDCSVTTEEGQLAVAAEIIDLAILRGSRKLQSDLDDYETVTSHYRSSLVSKPSNRTSTHDYLPCVNSFKYFHQRLAKITQSLSPSVQDDFVI